VRETEADGRTEFWSTVLRLVRRRNVLVPTVLVALVLAAGAYRLTPVSYTANTLMVLTTTEFGGTESQDPTKPTDLTNPMLNFNESLTTTSAILIQAMNTKDVAAQLATDGARSVVVDDGRSNPDLLGLNGPFLYIKVQATNAEAAHRTVLDAQSLMRAKLFTWQSTVGAPKKTYVSLVDVVPPTAPTVDRGRATKFGLLALIFGFGLMIGGAYLREQLRTRRQIRSEEARSLADLAPEGPSVSRSERVSHSLVHLPLDEVDDGASNGAFDEPVDGGAVREVAESAVPTKVRSARGSASSSGSSGKSPSATPGQRTTPQKRASKRSAAAAAASTRGKKDETALVSVPVKSNARPRNR
jgi:hypothetical protein